MTSGFGPSEKTTDTPDVKSDAKTDAKAKAQVDAEANAKTDKAAQASKSTERAVEAQPEQGGATAGGGTADSTASDGNVAIADFEEQAKSDRFTTVVSDEEVSPEAMDEARRRRTESRRAVASAENEAAAAAVRANYANQLADERSAEVGPELGELQRKAQTARAMAESAGGYGDDPAVYARRMQRESRAEAADEKQLSPRTQAEIEAGRNASSRNRPEPRNRDANNTVIPRDANQVPDFRKQGQPIQRSNSRSTSDTKR